MRKFLDENFLLSCDSSRKLYFDYAEPQPILDYHTHLNPRDVSENRRWDNITQLWLAEDHYKWRAMRGNGIAEEYCTGRAGDKEKFLKFAECMPRLLRNPLYHWCHLELSRYFGIDTILSPKTAEEVWERANAKIADNFNARACMNKYKVLAVCTTDDPSDDLQYHARVAKDASLKTKLFPTFRPDKAFAFEDPEQYSRYLDTLSKASGIKIDSFASLTSALQNRHDFFASRGCRVSDFGLDAPCFDENYSDAKIERVFKELLSGKNPDTADIRALKSALLIECAKMDFEAGWVRQLHIGPLRNANSRMFETLGPDTGFDCIGESNYTNSLAKHLDALDSNDKLGKTIIYNIHPKDNEMIAALIGCFQDNSCPGKLQLGSAWWFADQIDGMKKQIEAVSALSLLPNFVGMLTDSRSFLSFVRHEYFRRILCDILGREMEAGLLPDDFDLVGGMVADVAYNNAKKYFEFKGL